MDLKLSLKGEDDASQALRQAGRSLDDLNEGLKDTTEETKKLGSATKLLGLAELAKAFSTVSRAVIDFGKESVKAYLDAERASRRFEVAAGASAAALKAQAGALSDALGVDDDDIAKVQTLLLQYGEAPAAIDATTKALYDFAAATGQDASQAVSELISGVDSGRGAFKEYGVAVTMTGDKSTDLAAVTEELRKNFGGSGVDEADSLSGQLRATETLWGDTKEAMGGFLAKAVEGTGVVGALNSALGGIKDSLSAFNDVAKAATASGGSFFGTLKAIGNAWASDHGLGDMAFGANSMADVNSALNFMTGGKLGGGGKLPAGLSTKGTGDSKTTAGRRKDAANSKEKKAKAAKIDFESSDADFFEYQLEMDQGLTMDVAYANNKELEKALKERAAMQDAAAKESLAQLKRSAKEHEKEWDKMQKDISQKEQDFMEEGFAIGGILIDAINRGMEAETEEDAVLAAVDGVIDAVSVFADSIFPGAGRAIAGLGHTVTKGIKTGVNAHKNRGAGTSRGHEGMWVGERFHDGGWVGMNEHPAILQSGERVLSRGEVRSMGGASAIDSMAGQGRGGGGSINVSVNAMDAKGVSEFFQGAGGRGVFHALRSGRGDLGRAIGGGR